MDLQSAELRVTPASCWSPIQGPLLPWPEPGHLEGPVCGGCPTLGPQHSHTATAPDLSAFPGLTFAGAEINMPSQTGFKATSPLPAPFRPRRRPEARGGHRAERTVTCDGHRSLDGVHW